MSYFLCDRLITFLADCLVFCRLAEYTDEEKINRLLREYTDKKTNRRLAEKDLKLILEYTNMSNLDKYWLKEGKHTIYLTSRGFESSWINTNKVKNQGYYDGISFREFKAIIAEKEARKVDEALLKAIKEFDNECLREWDHRFELKYLKLQ